MSTDLGRRRRRQLLRRRREGGQGLVEFALVFPIFALMLFALVDLGRMVYVNNAIAEGAREGARWGAVQGRARDTTGRTGIANYTRGTMAAVPSPTVTVTCTDTAGTSRPNCVTNHLLTVRVSTTVGLFTPFLAQLVGPKTFTTTVQVTVSY